MQAGLSHGGFIHNQNIKGMFMAYFSDKWIPQHGDNTSPAGDAFKVVVSAYMMDSTENAKIPHSLSRTAKFKNEPQNWAA